MQKVNGILSNVTNEDIKLLRENPEEFWKDVIEISSYAFVGLNQLTDIIIPNSCKKINSRAFSSLKNLKAIYISDGVEKLEGQIFYDCASLIEIKLPDNIEELSANFFCGCYNIKSVKLPAQLKQISYGLFFSCMDIKNIEIPEGVEKIGKYAFRHCESLEEINLPNCIKEIEEGAFGECKSLKEITFPKNIKNLANYILYDCPNLKKVVIQSNLDEIGEGAFYGCKHLKQIQLPEKIGSIGKNVFEGCENLEFINIPDGIKQLGENIFKDCYSLTEIKLPQSIAKIDNGAFLNCSSLMYIDLPDNVIDLGDAVFKACSNLRYVKLSKNITKLPQSSFYQCENLEEIVLPDDLKIISDNALDKCKNLKKIDLPDGLQEVGKVAFRECKSLESIIIPDSVTKLGESAFENCENLKSVKLSSQLTKIEKTTFASCENLFEIDMTENIESIEKNAFMGCKNLENINLKNGLKRIGGGAFSYCSKLKYLEIPNTVEEIESGAFDYCPNLEFVKCSIEVKGLENIINRKNLSNVSDFQYIYLSKDKKNLIFTKTKNLELDKEYYCFPYTNKILQENYNKNIFNIIEWKYENKIKFIPQDYVMEIFPNEQMSNFFKNGNNKRWKEIIQLSGFDKLNNLEKENTLKDLLKIYYAIGGFSENQGESEKAYKYLLKYVINLQQENYDYRQVAFDIHTRFTRLELNGEYNPTFAQFFMKYYKNNPDFMKFELENINDPFVSEIDYLCQVHNQFDRILKLYPNRVVNGNEERALLTPKFLAQHSVIKHYYNIDKGNELLAETIGKYGYSQEQFKRIQEIFNKAKSIKDKYVIQADKSQGVDGINFRILEKDDPLGFVIGNITNCCQCIGGLADSCVVDGYTNPEAGFIVFEETIFNENGEDTGDRRILGQAYIWYDAKNKTVCFDNIEVPTKIIKEMINGDKNGKILSTKSLMKVVKQSALAIMRKMNENGIKVEKVTTGEGYNDLKNELKKNFQREPEPRAHPNYYVYSDAKNAQYVIATYDELTTETKEEIVKVADKINQDLACIKENLSQSNREV